MPFNWLFTITWYKIEISNFMIVQIFLSIPRVLNGEPLTWRHNVMEQNKMSGISNAKTPFVFPAEDELSMLIDQADSPNSKKQIFYALKRLMFSSSAGVPPIDTC